MIYFDKPPDPARILAILAEICARESGLEVKSLELDGIKIAPTRERDG